MGGQEVVVQLGDRRNSGFCLMCGTSLIEPWNDYQCCTKCTARIQESLQIFAIKRKNRKSVGSFQKKSTQILRQVEPMGVPIK